MINKTITIMKRTISVLSVALFWSALLMTSCSSEEKKGTATIYDGEIQWSNWSYTFVRGETSDGDLACGRLVLLLR